MRHKKRKGVHMLLTAAICTGISIGALSAGAAAVSPGSTGTVWRAEEAPAVLETVDKTQGVTYVMSEPEDGSEGSPIGINLNGNSVIIESAKKPEEEKTSWCRIYIDANANGVVDEGETAVKLRPWQAKTETDAEGNETTVKDENGNTVYEWGEESEYITLSMPIFGVYSQKATEPIVITNSAALNTLFGVYKGQADQITINNKGSAGTLFGVNEGTLGASESKGSVTINHTGSAGTLFGTCGSMVYGDVTVINQGGANTLMGVQGGTCIGNITVTNTNGGCSSCYGANQAEVTGDITVTNTNSIAGATYGIDTGRVIGDIIIHVANEGTASDSGVLYGAKGASVTGRLEIQSQGGRLAGGVFGLYDNSALESKNAEVPAVKINLIDTYVGSALMAVNCSSVISGNPVAVDVDMTGNSSLTGIFYGVYGAAQLTGDLDVNIQLDTMLSSSSPTLQLVYGNVMVTGNVTGTLKNIYTNSLYGLYGSSGSVYVTGDTELTMESCQVTGSCYGANAAYVAGNMTINGDNKTHMSSMNLMYGTTVGKDMAVTLYGYDSETSKGSYPMSCYGLYNKYTNEEYSVMGNLEIHLLGGEFNSVGALQYNSGVKGNVTMDMQGISIGANGNYGSSSYIVSGAQVDGNLSINTDEKCYFGYYFTGASSSTIGGNMIMDFKNTCTTSTSSVYGVSSANIGGKADIHIKGGSASYIYGVSNSNNNNIKGDCKVVIEDITAAGSYANIYGLSNGSYEGVTDVQIKNITGSGSGYIYGITYGTKVQKAFTLDINGIKNMEDCYPINGGEYNDTLTLTASDISVSRYFYAVGGCQSCAGKADITVTNVDADSWYGVSSTFEVQGVLTFKAENCTSKSYAAICSSNTSGAAGSTISLKNCTLKNMYSSYLVPAADMTVNITGGTYEISNTLFNVTGSNNAKVRINVTGAEFQNANTNSNMVLTNYAYGDVLVEMDIDSTSTFPEGYDMTASGNGLNGAPARITYGKELYLSGKYPVTSQQLTGLTKLSTNGFLGTLPTMTADKISFNNSQIIIPTGATVTAAEGYKLNYGALLLEGTLAGTCTEDNYEKTGFYMAGSGVIQDEMLNTLAAENKYYQVTLNYDPETITLSHNFGTISLRPEALFALTNAAASITCTPKVGFHLGEATYQEDGGEKKNMAVTESGASTIYKFDMAAKPVTVDIACGGNTLQVGKSVPDPVAIQNKEYTAEAPLYDFATLMIYNDSAEGGLTYSLAEGASLPAGLELTEGKLVGTPTTVNEAGDSVSFVVTGKNGCTATISLLIIVTTDENKGTGSQDGRILVDEEAKTINCMGSSVVIDVSGENTAIYIDDNRDGEKDFTDPAVQGDYSAYTLYGLYGYDSTRPLQITMKGGTLQYIYGAYDGDIKTEKGKDAVYIKLQGGTVSNRVYGLNKANIVGGVHIEQTEGKCSSLYSGYSSYSLGYSYIDRNKKVTVAGSYELSDTLEVSEFTLSQENYKGTLTINENASLKADKVTINSGTVIYNKGTVDYKTQYIANYSSSRHFLVGKGRLLCNGAALPENHTCKYLYYPFELSCEDLPTGKGIAAPKVDSSDNIYEDVLYACKDVSFYVNYDKVTGYTAYYTVNGENETALGTVDTASTAYTRTYVYLNSADGPTEVKIFYVPNDIEASVKFDVPEAAVNQSYETDNPLYDYSTVLLENDAMAGYGADRTYQLKKGSALPAGLKLEGGKVVGMPTAEAQTDVTVIITGRNGASVEVTLPYKVAVSPQEQPDINDKISYNGSILDLKGTSVVMYGDAANAKYVNIYLDENHDGVADNNKAFTYKESASINLSSASVYGYRDTEAPCEKDISIFAYGGTIRYLYGAAGTSSSEQATVNGTVSLYMKGASVNQLVAAGYYASAKELNLYCTAGTMNYKVFGAYYPGKVENVRFTFSEAAKYYSSSSSSYYMAATEGGNVTGNVYAVVGGKANSFSSNYGRYYGVYKTTVGGDVNYVIQGDWYTNRYNNNLAYSANIAGALNADWRTGRMGLSSTTNNATYNNYRTFALDSNVDSINIRVAEGAQMTSASRVYPYYGGTVQSVYMYVPNGMAGTVSTALKHPNNTSAYPVKSGFVYNKGVVEISGEYTVEEDWDISSLTVYPGGRLLIPENATVTVSNEIVCRGSIENEGVLSSNSYLNEEGSSIANQGTMTVTGYLNLKGKLNNAGSLTTKEKVWVYAAAEISNTGTWNSASYVYLYQTGAAIKNENVWNAEGIVFFNAAGATLTNTGEWTTNNRVQVQYDNDVIKNTGTWHMNWSVELNRGLLENTGIFQTAYKSTNSSQSVFVGTNGKLVNSGNWFGNAYLNLYGGCVENEGTIEVNQRSQGDTSYNLYLYSNASLINRENGVLKLNARIYNGGKIVNLGTMKQGYEGSYCNQLGKVYMAKPAELAKDLVDYTANYNTFYYPATAEYPAAAVTGVKLDPVYESGVEGDTNQYLQSEKEFTVTIEGYTEEYTSADVQKVVYGSAETEAQLTSVDNQWKGTMPKERMVVQLHVVKNTASQITIAPESVTIDSLTVNVRNNTIYDLKNLTVENDDGTEGSLSYAVSVTKPLPEGLTLTNGVIGGTPKYAYLGEEPYIAEIIVTGKNLTRATLQVKFNKIEKAVPSLTPPTNLYGYTDYTLDQVRLPKISTGTYSWPDSSVVITDKCLAGEKFDLYFTPNDTANYDWSKANISAGTWNEQEGRLECKVPIYMYKIAPSYTVPTDIKATYGNTLADVSLPSDEAGAFVWQNTAASVGNVGRRRFYATYVPTDTGRYNTMQNISIYVTVEPKPVTATIPTGLRTFRDYTISQVVLPEVEGGTYKWLSAASTVVQENTKYKAVFVPDDNTNYKWTIGEGLSYSEAYGGYVFEVTIQVAFHEEGKHVWEDKYDETYHWKECICGEISGKAKHEMSKYTDEGAVHRTQCANCEYAIEEAHSYGTRKSDDKQHWYECACGDRISVSNHYYSKYVYDEDTHWTECSCGARTAAVSHTYSTAKHDSTSHWKQCVCGAKAEVEKHSYTVLKHDKENHWYECSCGQKNSVEAHAFGDWICDEEQENHYRICACGQRETGAHSYGDLTAVDGNTHKQVCEACGDAVVADHTWDAGVITVTPTELLTGLKVYTCKGCGRTKEEVLPKNKPPHTNENHILAWDADDHWEVCDDGDNYEFKETRAAHEFTDWQVDEKAGTHWKECKVCGYKIEEGSHTWTVKYDSENHWQECSACGTKKNVKAHDGTLAVKTDEVNHWKECSCGRRTEIEQHVYRKYSFDEKNHWDECSCGSKKNIVEHSYGGWQPTADGTKHYRECVCGSKQEADHSTTYTWTPDETDSTKHIGVCGDCKGGTVTEAHIWDAGKVTLSPTTSAEGVRTYTCTKCKAEKTESIPKLAESHTHSFGSWQTSDTEHWKKCSCGDESNRGTHTWDKGTVTVEPTETETGIKTYKCTVCDREKTEELPVLTHVHSYGESYVYDENSHWKECSCKKISYKASHSFGKGVVLKPATLEEEGIMQYQCSVCGAVKQTVLPKLTENHEHSFGDWAADDDLNHTRVCSCGKKETRSHSFGGWITDGDKNHVRTCRSCGQKVYHGHEWDDGEITKEAVAYSEDVRKDENGNIVCDEAGNPIIDVVEAEDGEITYTCRVCGQTRIEPYSSDEHLHKYGDVKIVDEKTHKRVCSICRNEVVENHTWDEGIVTKAATETEEGKLTYTCTVCHYKKTESIPKHKHECDSWIPDPEDETRHTGSCSYGDIELTEEHSYDEGDVIKEATDTEAGEIVYTCTKCGYEKTESFTKHTHEYGDWISKDETNHEKACACGDKVTEAHSFDKGKITKPATVEAPGEMTYTCSVCGGTKVLPLEKLPDTHVHKYGWEKADDETHQFICGCGLVKETEAHIFEIVSNGPDTHRKSCTKCEAAIDEEPHNWELQSEIPATHTEQGKKTYVCRDCGETKTETVEKLKEHAYGAWTYQDENNHSKACVCGQAVTEAHTWDAGVVTTEATQTAEGLKTYTCTACGGTKTEKLPKLSPNPENPDDPEKLEEGAEFVDESSKGKFVVVNPAEIDPEDTDTSPAVTYSGCTDADAEEAVVPDTITVNGVEYRIVAILDGAFKNNTKLKRITIGTNIKTIGESAFEGCTALETLVFKKTSKVKIIGKRAFYKCTSLKKVTIPKSVVAIKDSAFEGCKKLTTVTFQSGSKLKTLGAKVFKGCVALKKITIPKNVTSIGTSAFEGCKKLATVKFQSGSKLKTLGAKVFKKCVALKKITIPGKVTTIGANAFYGCKKLATITISSTKLKKVGKNAFKGIKSTAKIKVPAKKLKAYKKLLKSKGQGKKVKIVKK